MITRRQFIISSSFAGAATIIGAPKIASGAVTKNVSYGDNLLDVYSPSGRTGRPIMMFVHGGAWALGNRGQVGRKPKFFNRAGFVFVSVGYTLYPAASAETQAMQIGRSVEFVRKNATRFGGDPERIILMGHSAGCHLASLATLSGQAKGLRGLICNDTGAYDLFYLAKVNGGALPVIYKAPFRKRKFWTRWSPITYAANNPTLPMLVPWSGGRNRDRITANFISALKKNNADVTGFNGEAYSHGSINTSIGKRGDRLTTAMLEFISTALAKPVCDTAAPASGSACVEMN